MTDLSVGAQAMFDKVCSYGHVSMVELTRAYENACGEGTAHGRTAIFLDELNICLWADVTDEFAEAFNEIRTLVDIEPCHWFVYLADGAIPKMPLAKRPPKNGYREPHWCPIALNAKPGCRHLSTAEPVVR